MNASNFPLGTLVGITTYAGNYETRLILRKTLRHFRWRNGPDVPLLVVSDGPILDSEIYRYADYVLCRPGPSGLQQGELENLRLMVDFAHGRGYRYLVKSAGDVIMNRPEWIRTALEFLLSKGRRILSTHWFHNDSWVVGTKFFVADVDFLRQVLPEKVTAANLEVMLTESIRRHYPLEEIASLINSNTGEAHEVEGELAEWQWEHAHRLYKFRHLDDETDLIERIGHRYFLYPALRLVRQLHRSLKRD